MKKYMAAYLDKDGCLTNGFMDGLSWHFYTLDADEKYYLEAGTSSGWSVDKLNAHSLFDNDRFVFGQNLNRLRKTIEKKDFIRRWGKKVKPEFDFQCPDCNWCFNAPNPIGDDYYNTFIEDSSQKVSCFCGCRFNVQHVNTIQTTSTVTK